MATRWSCGVENKYETFSVREKHWNFFPGWKTLTYSCRLWDSNPRPHSNSVVMITPRLARCLNHSAIEHWKKYKFFIHITELYVYGKGLTLKEKPETQGRSRWEMSGISQHFLHPPLTEKQAVKAGGATWQHATQNTWSNKKKIGVPCSRKR